MVMETDVEIVVEDDPEPVPADFIAALRGPHRTSYMAPQNGSLWKCRQLFC